MDVADGLVACDWRVDITSCENLHERWIITAVLVVCVCFYVVLAVIGYGILWARHRYHLSPVGPIINFRHPDGGIRPKPIESFCALSIAGLLGEYLLDPSLARSLSWIILTEQEAFLVFHTKFKFMFFYFPANLATEWSHTLVSPLVCCLPSNSLSRSISIRTHALTHSLSPLHSTYSPLLFPSQFGR